MLTHTFGAQSLFQDVKTLNRMCVRSEAHYATAVAPAVKKLIAAWTIGHSGLKARIFTLLTLIMTCQFESSSLVLLLQWSGFVEEQW